MNTNNILEYTEKYKELSKNLIDFNFIGSRETTWHSPSNIALIKYWGKFGDQLPQNPSISFTLKNSKTITKIEYRKASGVEPTVEYFFKGHRNPAFEEKVKKYFVKISEYLPFLKNLNLVIHSRNTFPHSTGIASSASAFSALALCLCSIENELFQTLNNKDDFLLILHLMRF